MIPVLLLISAACSGLYLLFFCTRAASWPKTAAKTLAILPLAGVATVSESHWLLPTALVLCAFGDFALSRDGEGWFLAGMGGFGLGHLAYVGLFWTAAAAPTLGLQWLALSALAIFAILMLRYLWPRSGALRWPVLGYILFIAAMFLAGWLVPEALVLWIGVTLFVASDSLIAFEKFGEGADVPGIAPAIWITYWLAQALILFEWN